MRVNRMSDGGAEQMSSPSLMDGALSLLTVH